MFEYNGWCNKETLLSEIRRLEKVEEQLTRVVLELHDALAAGGAPIPKDKFVAGCISSVVKAREAVAKAAEVKQKNAEVRKVALAKLTPEEIEIFGLGKKAKATRSVR